MKGKILGANAEGGTIAGADSKRYKFELVQWNNDRPPTLGQEVDFEIADAGHAIDVFALRSVPIFEPKIAELFGEGANSPLGRRLIALLSGNPVFQISVALLVASVFFRFVYLTGSVIASATVLMPDGGSYTVVNIGDLIDFLKTSLEQAAAAADLGGQLMGSLPFAPAGSGNGHDLANGLRGIEALTNLFYIAYLVPIGAIATIVQALRERATAKLALATGVASIASFLGLFIWRWAIVSGMKSIGSDFGATLASQSIHYGFGAYLILLGGVLLVGSALGLIRLPQKS